MIQSNETKRYNNEHPTIKRYFDRAELAVLIHKHLDKSTNQRTRISNLTIPPQHCR